MDTADMINQRLDSIARKLRTSRIRTAWQKHRLLNRRAIPPRERELLRNVDSRISPADEMYTGDIDHYFAVGLSAIRCIDEALDRAGLHAAGEVLDMPCGYGRVTRFLARRFPEAHITGCELLPDAVSFCAHAFGASPAYSSTDLARLSLHRTFDLIWCGSLVTHLDAERTLDLVRFFDRHMTPGGVLVFTAHGETVRQRIVTREFTYGLDETTLAPFVATHDREGYAYANYPGESRYGVSLISPDWIRAAVQRVTALREVCFHAGGWDAHQDVYAFVKPPDTAAQP